MASKRVLTAAAAAAAATIAAAISTGTAWAGGPTDSTVDDSPGPPGNYGGMFSALGSGTFIEPNGQNVEVGYNEYGYTAAEAQTNVVRQCLNEGGQNCSSDIVTNDNLCIVSIVDGRTNVNSGGAGPTIEAARQDALTRAAANNMPMSPDSAVLISDCP
jgi:hypothetical protein